MKIYSCDQFVLPLPEGHRFPMSKYALLRQKLEARGVGPEDSIELPPLATDTDLRLAHDEDYLHRVSSGDLTRQEIKALGFPWSPQLVERSRCSCGATIAAGRAALAGGFAVNLAGGTHHASRSAPQGFCVFNDTAVASLVLLKEMLCQSVLIVDLDVHQGNGTAAILAEEPRVFTLSVHGARNFPLRKETSDLDVPLEDGVTDSDYLAQLRPALATAFETQKPDVVFYIAGADPYEKDRFGRISLSMDGLYERDRMVFDTCNARRVPCATVMGGGYSKDVDEIVAIHDQTVSLALRAQKSWGKS